MHKLVQMDLSVCLYNNVCSQVCIQTNHESSVLVTDPTQLRSYFQFLPILKVGKEGLRGQLCQDQLRMVRPPSKLFLLCLAPISLFCIWLCSPATQACSQSPPSSFLCIPPFPDSIVNCLSVNSPSHSSPHSLRPEPGSLCQPASPPLSPTRLDQLERRKIQISVQAGYSFAASTVLATWLWTRLTSAKVLVTLITNDINDKEALFLQHALCDLGAQVSLRQVLP